jgi:tetratricopeptide (TPR) repeat protein
MATRKSDNSSCARWGSCLIVLVLTASAPIPPAAGTRAPQTAPVAHSSQTPTANEAGQTIDDLTRALRQCRDEGAAGYIRYRLGIMQFKAGRMAEAAAAFEPLAHEPQASELLRVCSLNMAGQIARLQGEHAQALQAFADLAGLTEKWPTLDPQDRSRPALHTLWRAALISRAEIQESRKNLAAAAAEYECLLQGEKDHPPGEVDDNQMPLVMDRLSQLCLQMQDAGRYLSLTADLIARFPAYPRTPMVELERVCVQALGDAPSAREYPPGVLYAPARFIAHLRRRGAAGPAEAVLNGIERLCRKYEDAPLGLLLDYDYAWMLDAVGRRDQAIEVLARIAAPGEPNETVAPEVAPSHEEVLRRYAVLQHALLLAERQDYDKALRILTGLPPAPDRSSHASQLAESMIRNVQTLKREVSKNVLHGEK